MYDNLLIDQLGGLVHVRLNRPEALNALSPQMIEGLLAVLQGDAPVLISGEGRAFCSGGDVKMVWGALKEQGLSAPEAQGYFEGEYTMNAALYARQNSFVSYLNGICMGGGYGIAAHGSHIIACEDSVFAMPEVKIGFFPDVGAAYPLSRLPYELGTWLAVTGNSVGADDLMFAGIAQSYVPKELFNDFKACMAREGVEEAILTYGQPSDERGVLRQYYQLIARCFAHDRVEDIVEALKADGGAFALKTLDDMRARSPLAMKIALRHIRLAKHDDFEAVISRDQVLARRIMGNHDFMEGIRASLIDKDGSPKWKPATLEEVDDDMLAIYFGGIGV